MIAQVPNLDTILKRHKIHPKFWPEFRAAVEEDVRLGDELRTRLNHVANYQAAAKDILAATGQATTSSRRPITNRRLPYESLLIDDIESEDALLVTSAGAPSAAR